LLYTCKAIFLASGQVGLSYYFLFDLKVFELLLIICLLFLLCADSDWGNLDHISQPRNTTWSCKFCLFRLEHYFRLLKASWSSPWFITHAYFYTSYKELTLGMPNLKCAGSLQLWSKHVLVPSVVDSCYKPCVALSQCFVASSGWSSLYLINGTSDIMALSTNKVVALLGSY